MDIFISHASEDKEAVARPLAVELQSRGWKVWYDEFELRLGDPLRATIDRGLLETRFGLVVLSPSFFRKEWPQRELDGLTARELSGTGKVILPVWHQVAYEDVLTFSPPLANKLAVETRAGLPVVVDEIERTLRAPRIRSAPSAGSGQGRRRVWLASARPRPRSQREIRERNDTRQFSVGPPPRPAETTRRIAFILGITAALTVIAIALVRTIAV